MYSACRVAIQYILNYVLFVDSLSATPLGNMTMSGLGLVTKPGGDIATPEQVLKQADIAAAISRARISVSGGENAPINGDGEFFGGVWAFHRRPSALRMPSCSWL